MKLTKKDLSSVAANRVFKGQTKMLIGMPVGAFVSLLAVSAVSKTLTMVVAMAVIGIYFMWMVKLDKASKALAKDLNAQARAEGIQFEG